MRYHDGVTDVVTEDADTIESHLADLGIGGDDSVELDETDLCYLRGLADAAGAEAEGEEWFCFIDDWDVRVRWWEGR